MNNNMTTVIIKVALATDDPECMLGGSHAVSVCVCSICVRRQSLILYPDPCVVTLETPHKETAHHGHTAGTWQSQDLNPSLSDSLSPETTTTPALLPCLLSQCGEEGPKIPMSSQKSLRQAPRELCGLQSLPTNAEKQA